MSRGGVKKNGVFLDVNHEMDVVECMVGCPAGHAPKYTAHERALYFNSTFFLARFGNRHGLNKRWSVSILQPLFFFFFFLV